MTGEFARRVHEQKQGVVDGFTKKYAVHRLVYFEVFDEMADAHARERRIKRWLRKWKLDLIETPIRPGVIFMTISRREAALGPGSRYARPGWFIWWNA